MSVLASLLIVAAAPWQAPEAPTPLSVAYSGVPGVVGQPAVRMQIHNATQTIEGTQVVTESLSLLKNTSDVELKLQIALPWNSFCTNEDFLVPPSTLKATWDKADVALASDWKGLADKPSGPRFRAKNYLLTATVKPNATHALRVRYETPLGRGGLDNLLRVVPYGVENGLRWSGPIEQFQLAVKHAPKAVFQVFSATPNWGWQIGPSGAFLKREAFEPRSPLLLFSFYPGGFGDIGGRNSKGGGGG